MISGLVFLGAIGLCRLLLVAAIAVVWVVLQERKT